MIDLFHSYMHNIVIQQERPKSHKRDNENDLYKSQDPLYRLNNKQVLPEENGQSYAKDSSHANHRK